VVLVAVPAHLIARAFRPGAAEPPGSTSFAGALLTVLCGVLVEGGETRIAVVVAALTMVLLGSKQPIHAWARALTAQDVRATLQFAAISGVILPLVPDRPLGPYGAFNPYTTWLMVVLISGLGFAGYAAIRLFGARAGILLTGLFGGLASSTASTLAFSRRSREEPGLDAHYALAVAAACTVMLPRVLAALAVINPAFARTLLVPFGLMALPGVVYMAWVWRRSTSQPPPVGPASIVKTMGGAGSSKGVESAAPARRASPMRRTPSSTVKVKESPSVLPAAPSRMRKERAPLSER
jgi:uncharacterized membrane protein (DUF4010 family)